MRQAAFALCALAGCLWGCHRGSEQKPAAAREPFSGHALHAPHATAPIELDGELEEPDWIRAARAGPFIFATGGEARPYSDARFLWDDSALYVGLYAADEDIRARVTAHDGPVWLDDAFSLHLTPDVMGAPTYVLDISAGGVITDARRGADGQLDVAWESGATVGVDRDGTPNDPSDDDEEWVIEARISLRAMGVSATEGARLLVDVSRCDTPRAGGPRRCATFGTPKDRRVIELSR